ncbi:MAG TPA: hypothetical protein VGB56_09580 [Flavisolibacter sp.]
MKSLLIVLAVFASSFTSTGFARETVKVSNAALKNFNSTFSTAAEVNWSATNGFYKANFVFKGQHAAAFFNEDGTLAAVTRNISSLQLPFSLQVSLKQDYSAFWISELFEVSTDHGTEYYMTLENSDQKVILKATPNGSWSKHKKTRKL